MASWHSSNSGARHWRPTAPAAATLLCRTGEGVRRNGPLDIRGGVGEALNPGGLAGDYSGSSSIGASRAQAAPGLALPAQAGTTGLHSSWTMATGGERLLAIAEARLAA